MTSITTLDPLASNATTMFDDYEEPPAPDGPAIDAEMITTGLVYGATFIIGVIGNGLIIYSVVHFRRMKSLSNVFLASLATADLMLILVCVPVKFGQLFSYTWTFGEFACKSVHYVQNVSAICSVFTLTAMSIERYYAIMHPVKCLYICTMSQTKRIIVVTWILSLIMAAPVNWIQIHKEVGSRYKAYWCVRDWSNPLLWQLYEVYMLMIILVVPLLIMSYSYTHICYRLWIVMGQRTVAVPLGAEDDTLDNTSFAEDAPAHTNINKTITNSNNNHNNNNNNNNNNHHHHSVYLNRTDNNSNQTVRQVIKMLIAVVIIFVICWSPLLILNVLTAFGIVQPLNYGNLKAIRISANLFSYINSCVNPIIYGFMSQNFRASFKAALKKCLGCA